MKPAIELHIEELVLHGFRSADRHRIGEAAELELARLLSEQGVPVGIGDDFHASRLDGGSVTLAPGGRPETVGVEIARSVHGSLMGSKGKEQLAARGHTVRDGA